MNDKLNLVGYASGIAANNVDTGLAPWYLKYHSELFQTLPFNVTWQEMITSVSLKRKKDALLEVSALNLQLAQQTALLAAAKEKFCVIGGDHSCAIGTWSGVASAFRKQGDIGLVWIDAHLDSHTPESSISHNIHGMPVAHLLGAGFPSLLSLLTEQSALKPENICLLGIRSYQTEEYQFLLNLGVKIIFMDEILREGIAKTLQSAFAYVARNTVGIGISIDLDSIDPKDAPGVGYREPNGIPGEQLLAALTNISPTIRLLGLEIAEYNPLRDEQQKTAKLLVEIIRAVYSPFFCSSV
jgi:arginase